MRSLRLLIPSFGLLLLLAVAVRTDLRTRRIPNKLVLLGLLGGAVWHLLGPAGHWTFDPVQPGAAGLLGFLLGAVAMLAGFFPLYVLRVTGAGDVKLLAAVGGIFGATSDHWLHLPALALSVLTAGGVLSLCRMVALGASARVMRNVWQVFRVFAWRAAGYVAPVDADFVTVDRMPYAIAIALGAVFCALASSVGWFAWL